MAMRRRAMPRERVRIDQVAAREKVQYDYEYRTRERTRRETSDKPARHARPPSQLARRTEQEDHGRRV